MTIEIHEPKLETLIRERMASGRFQSIEDALLEALQSSDGTVNPPELPRPGKSLAQLFMESPLAGSGIEFERIRDYPEPIEL